MVTLVFTDLVGSTELTGRLGDDRANALRREHFDTLTRATERRGGRVVKNQGDGLMLTFDSAVDAVAAAIDMQRAVDAIGRNDEPLSMRIGVHVGEPEEADGDYFGTPVNVASRLCGAATGGQIVASDLVRAIVGSRGGFTFTPLGALELRGVDEPVPACEIKWEPARRIVPLPPTLPTRDSTRLVGRVDELATLRDALGRATEGSLQLVLLAGEPGIGKTRFVLEVARDAHAAGATVLYGRCDEELPAPYRPFAEALRHLAAHGDEDLGEAARIAATEGGTAPTEDPGSDRLRLFDAVASVLARVGDPTVLIIDDLHWADRPTLLLLRHLAREQPEASLLLIGTYRDVEVDRTHPLAEMLTELRRDVKHERLLLRGLSPSDVEQYLTERAGHALDPAGRALAIAIHRETEGNPFFVREILRHLVETGAIFERDGRWTSEKTIEDVGLPESIRDVIGRRLTRLGHDATSVLQIASVIGRDFDLRLLARLSDRSEDALADLLDGAVAVGGVIVEAPSALDRFTFSHALVRETLHEELTTSRRLRLHRRAAEALETLHGNDLDPVLDEIARHYSEAAATGVEDKAIEFARRAAARAMRLLAFEDAAAHLGRALETLELLGEPDPAQEVPLLLEKAEAHRLALETRQARRDATRAFDLARAAGRTEQMVQAVLTHAGLWIDIGMMNKELLGLIDRTLGALPLEHPAVPKLLGRKAMEHFVGDQDELERSSLRALELARALGDPATIGYALVARRHAVSGPDRLDDRLAMTEEALRIATEIGDVEMDVRARGFRLADLLEAGRGDELDAALDQLHQIAGDEAPPLHRYFGWLQQVGRALREGRLDDAERLVEPVSAWAARNERVTSVLATAYQRQQLHMLRGTGTEMDDAGIRTLVGFANVVEGGLFTTIPLLQLVGRDKDARAAYERLRGSDPRGLPLNWWYLPAVQGLGEIAASYEDQELARAVYDMALPYENRICAGAGTALVSTIGSVPDVLGVSCLVLQRAGEAVSWFERGIEANRSVRARPWAARATALLARALVERNHPGDADRARGALDEALAEFEAMGMGGPIVEDARALRARL